MQNFYINMAFSVLLELLKATIPADGTSKKTWKKAFAKVFREIGKIYKDDPEFQDLVK